MWAKKSSSKPPNARNTSARQQKAAPLAQKIIAGIVILPFVPFDTLQNTTSAERIPQVVDETARSSGILEPRRLDERQQLGRYGSHGPIPIERFDERFDPSGRRFDIRIEQNEIVRIEILQRPVITSGEPVVTVQYDSPHSGKFRVRARRANRPSNRCRPRRRRPPSGTDASTEGRKRRKCPAPFQFRITISVFVRIPCGPDRPGTCVSTACATTSTGRGIRGSSAPDAARSVPLFHGEPPPLLRRKSGSKSIS